MQWFETYDNVTCLGRAFVDAGMPASELQHYYEKPWKWTQEWVALQEGGTVKLEEVLDG